MSGELLWEPRGDWREASALGRFAAAAPGSPGDYGSLLRWSVDEPDAFWSMVWREAGLGEPGGPALADASMPGARWFPGVQVNYAERILDGLGDEAVIARSQTRDEIRLSADELREQVRRCATGLRRLGVERGDRVAAYLPNTPEAVVGLLATAAIGAIWSSCPPEFGTTGVIDRFSQIEPKVLLACDGYAYGAKRIDRAEAVATIAGALPSLQHVVAVPYLDPAGEDGWGALLAEDGPLAPERVPFEHPLYVLFSSGTTGLPKPIVHGHGAMLVEHWKIHRLHHDVGEGDRFFWFSTTGWMMWNYLVSALLTGATIVLFDGDPAQPGPEALWALTDELGVTFLGVGAPLLTAGMRAGLRPREQFGLPALRAIGSTGSPLSEDGFLWVRDAVGVPVHSVSGGTDVCSAFLGAAPGVPVWSGELSCALLGCDVRAFGPDGRELPAGEIGELVVASPLPSMPVGFWGDEDGSRLRAAYFEDFPGVWRHGDWVTLTERGSAVIHGRSDATLNRGGVRLGTAELYGVVERMPEIADSLVIHLPGGDLGELVLFVVPAEGVDLDEALVRHIRTTLRTELSPRHAPDRVEAVPGIPRTLSGKKCEVPVKRILLGADPAEVVNPSSLQDPSALDWFARTVGS